MELLVTPEASCALCQRRDCAQATNLSLSHDRMERQMVRRVLAAVILAGTPVLAQTQSTSAPLLVTATVVSTCNVDVPRSAQSSTFATTPVSVTCAKGSTAPRVERPLAPRRSEVRDAVLIINF
jgi:hypothetical protein